MFRINSWAIAFCIPTIYTCVHTRQTGSISAEEQKTIQADTLRLYNAAHPQHWLSNERQSLIFKVDSFFWWDAWRFELKGNYVKLCYLQNIFRTHCLCLNPNKHFTSTKVLYKAIREVLFNAILCLTRLTGIFQCTFNKVHISKPDDNMSSSIWTWKMMSIAHSLF